MSPRVSVVVPVYDVVNTLERCVRSLLEQTLRDIEVILVDDGSTDGSADLCAALAGEDDRVQFLDRRHGGVSSARNAGLAAATGTYLTFLDGDDWADLNLLEALVEAAVSTSADVVIAGCYVDVVDRDGQLVTSRTIVPDAGVIGPGRPAPALTDDFLNLLGYAWNKLYRRDLLDHGPITFPVDLSLGEDTVFNADALKQASVVAMLDRPFVHYAQRSRTSLGTAFRPDFLSLRLRAIEAVRSVLEHWTVDRRDVEMAVASLQLSALRGLARTTSARPHVSLRERASHFRLARRAINGLMEAPLSAKQRIILWVLRYGPASAVVTVFSIRHRLRGVA